MESKRLAVYIDGFNLYFGMIANGLNHCKWLDVYQLSQSIKHESHSLSIVKYFTSRVIDDPSKIKRQNTYLEAVATRDVEIIYGQYRKYIMKCRQCQNNWNYFGEKMTNVNIATNMLVDAYEDKYDVAILISGDSDLVSPVKSIREIFPQKEIWIAFPPSRSGVDLKKAANGSFVLGKHKLEMSQLPDMVVSKYGFALKRPPEWK